MTQLLNIARQFSQRAVIEAVIQGGPISRASIARQTGLSKQTVSEVMRELELDGWVKPSGRTHGHLGRSAVNYELVPSAAYIAAVDLGGTKVRVAISDLACQLSADEVEPTTQAGGQAVIEQIATLCWRVAARHQIPRERIRLAVIGVPGAPDAATGQVRLAPNIPGFDALNVSAALETALGMDVILENDVNLAVVGENWQGEGQGIDDLAYVAVGTGVGSGLMVGGKLVRGAGHAAGELGFLPFGADPFSPESRRSGAFEQVAASFAIQRGYCARCGEMLSVPEIFDRATAGDGHAVEVLDELARYLARGIGAIAAITNPKKVVLGGSIGMRPELIQRIGHYLPRCVPYPIEVSASALGAWAAITGATALGLEHLHNVLFAASTPEPKMTRPPAQTIIFQRTEPA